MTTSKELIDRIDEVRYNPSAIQRIVVDMVEEVTDGEHRLIDPSNPFTLLLETATATAGAVMSSHASQTRTLYAKQAESLADLYKHMSDKNAVGRFAVPSRTFLQLRISKEELLRDAVMVGATNIRKVTIPINTRFQMNNVFFGIYYPIDIRVMPHGGIHVNWDRSIENPMHAIAGNVLNTSLWRSPANIEYLVIDIPVEQFRVDSGFYPLSYATGMKKTIPFTNRFYAIRAYTKLFGVWKEMEISHTEQVFDRRKPTLVVQVHDTMIQVNVPQIYLTERTVGETLRIDVYTTIGELDLILGNYTSESYGADWIDLDAPEGTVYTAALRKITTMALSSDSNTSGGKNGLTFEELRELVVYTSRANGYTFSDLVNRTKELGYDLSLQYDNITDRQYLATRVLPQPVDTDSISAIGVAVAAFDFTTSGLVASTTVKVAADTITLLPSTIFSYVDGVLAISDSAILNNVGIYNSETIATELNSGKYMYTPFHYVMDIKPNDFTARCYYLDAPEITEREFIDTNASYPLDVSIKRVQIIKQDQGYQLVILLRAGEAVKTLRDDQVSVQIAFTPKTASKLTYLTGTLYTVDSQVVYVEGERVYTFDLDTEYDIDEDDYLALTNFQMFGNDTNEYGIQLTETIDVFIAVNDYTAIGTVSSDIDTLMSQQLLPAGAAGITHERVTLKLGDRLEHMEGKALTFMGDTTYETYAADVPLINATPQFLLDGDGHLDVSLDGNNDVVYTVISDVGQPTLDGNGDPVMSNLAGDTKLDGNGDPIVAGIAERTRRTELVLLDAKYRYTTEDAMMVYRDSLPVSIVSYVTEDIETISATLAPRTELRFAPRSNSGNVTITVKDGITLDVAADLSFVIDIYLSGSVFDDLAIRKEITRAVNKAINTSIVERTISTYGISEGIDALTDDTVMGIYVHPITEDALNVFSIVHEGSGFSVGSKMIVLSDGTLKIVDDVAINFNRHTA